MKKTLLLSFLMSLFCLGYTNAYNKIEYPTTALSLHSNIFYSYDTNTKDANVTETATLQDDGNGSLIIDAPKYTYLRVYIENNSEYTETIKFDYTYTGDKFRLEADYTDIKIGSFSKTLSPGDKISIMLKSDTEASTAVLKNFSCSVDKPVAGYCIKFVTTEGCTLNVSSESTTSTTNVSSLITDNNTSSVTVGAGNALDRPASFIVNATAPAGKKLKGWYTMNGSTKSELMWLGNPSAFDVEESATYYAEYIDEATPLYFIKGTTKIYDDLNAANTSAKSGDIIVMTGSGVLPSGDYTIKEGVTLLIPSDASNSCYNTDLGPAYTKNFSDPTAYIKMTMQNGARITVNGIICINGTMAAGAAGTGKAGAVTGSYGCIDMNEGSSITLNSGSVLFCWGYITGSGKVDAQNGSKVYENFQFTDFRGGSITQAMANEGGMQADDETKYKKRVFPITQYYIQNIEASLTINYGAEEYVISNVYADNQYNSTGAFLLIGKDSESALFKLSTGSKLRKEYNPANDRMTYDITGNGSLSKIEMVVNGFVVASSAYTLPLTNNITLNANNGTLTSEYDLALLPGVEMNIGSDATFVVNEGTRFYVYDKDEYKAEYLYPVAENLSISHSPTKAATRTFASLEDAKICVEGTMTTNGYAYTTAGGANITGNGVVNVNKKGTDTCTYQVIQGSRGLEYVEIPIYSLLNGDANNDKKVDIADASAIINYLLTNQASASFNSKAADVNNSGSVTAEDIQSLMNIVLKK